MFEMEENRGTRLSKKLVLKLFCITIMGKLIYY